MQASFNFSNIVSAINAAHAGVEAAKKEGARYAVECGRLLQEAKETVPHGQWDGWIKANCKFSPRTAQLYMRVANHVGTDPAKAQRVADLSLRELDQQSRRSRLPKHPAVADVDGPTTDAMRVAYICAWIGNQSGDGALGGLMYLLDSFENGVTPKDIGRSLRSLVSERNPENVAAYEPIIGMLERAKAPDVRKAVISALRAH